MVKHSYFSGGLLLRALTLLCVALPLLATARDEPFLKATQQWVAEQFASAPLSTDMPLRLEVVLGKLDPRLQLAPCTKVETFLPPGTRLWGRSRVGLRCTDGAARWQVFLPVQVKAIGPAWVLRSALPANSVLTEKDAVLTDVDWAEAASAVLPRASDWIGKSLARTSASGQTLSAAMIRSTPIFATGASVKLLSQGPGFSISSAGHALAPGVSGQDVRVRLESGRILSGKVNSDGVVTIGL